MLPFVELTFWKRERKAIKNKHCKNFTFICYLVMIPIDKGKADQVKWIGALDRRGETFILSEEEGVSHLDTWRKEGQPV